MKISFIVVSVLFTGLQLTMAYTGYGQGLADKKIRLEVKDEFLPDIFKAIEDQTSFHFAYNPVVAQKYKASVNDASITVEEALNVILKDTPLKYNLIGNKILITNSAHSVRMEPLTPLFRNYEVSEIRLEKLTKSISGIITDVDGNPLTGVNVLVKGTNKGTSTDFEGRFELTGIDDQDVLVITYVGYQTQEIPVAAKSVVNIILTEDAQLLDEVVVVGYGTQKKVNLIGAVGQINIEDMVTQPVSNTDQLLYGKVAGLSITQNSGEPGKGSEISIRGGVLGNSAPLIIVDGMQVSSFNDVSPSDIATISVLKDASSAAIYGARGANGVILITTKEAKSGKPTISYKTSYGWTNPTALPELLSGVDYLEAMNERDVVMGGPVRYTQDIIQAYKAGTLNPNYFGSTDWFSEIFRPGGFMDHYASVTGGGERSRYFLSLNYNRQEGAFIGRSSLDNYNARIKLNTKVNDRISLGMNINGYVRNNKSSAGMTRGDGGAFRFAIHSDPIRPVYYTNGLYNAASSYGERDINDDLILYSDGNLIGSAYRGENDRDNYALNARMNANIEIFEGFTFEPAVVYNFDTYLSNYFYPTYQYYFEPEQINISVRESKNELSMDADFRNTIQFDNILRYQKRFGGKHRIGGLLGYQFFKETNYGSDDNGYGVLGASGSTLPLNSLRGLKNTTADIFTLGNSKRTRAFNSVFGRLEYDLLDRYLFEMNLRYDGSSVFPQDNRYAMFPALSAGWRFSEEPMWANLKNVLTNGKVRASWGRLGGVNDLGYYPYQFVYVPGKDYLFDDDNALVPGVAVDNFVDQNIKWQEEETINIGLDLEFDENISLSVDRYRRITDDLLLEDQVPYSAGNLGNPVSNLGKVRNQGWEFLVSWVSKPQSKFKFGLSANLALNENEILELPDGKPIINLSIPAIYQEGQPIDAYYGYVFDGIYQSEEEIANAPDPGYIIEPGYRKYKDISGPDGTPDGEIDNNDFAIIGNPNPKAIYGFSGNFGFKGFDMQFVCSGMVGVDRWRPQNGNDVGVGNMTSEWLNRWSETNPSNTLPILGSDRLKSSWNVEKADFLRLKVFELGYSLPKGLMEKMGMNQLRIYANGSNLLTFTDYSKGFEPEKSRNNRRSENYPLNRNITFGVNLKF